MSNEHTATVSHEDAKLEIREGAPVCVYVGSDRYEGKIVHVSQSKHQIMVTYSGPTADKFTMRKDGKYRGAGNHRGCYVGPWYTGCGYSDPCF